jgi:uncharacterized protein (DUF1800 family)
MRKALLPSLLVLAALACARTASLNSSPRAADRGRAYTPAPAGAREQTADQQIQHVLSRLAFGARPGDVAAVRAMGVDAYIDQQLHPERIADRAAETALARYTALDAQTEDIVAAYQVQQQQQRISREAETAALAKAKTAADSMAARQLVRQQAAPQRMVDAPMAGQPMGPLPARANNDLISAKITRSVLSERQLYEVVVDFWENHFSIFQNKNPTRLYVLEYDRDVIRPHAMGNFRELLGAVAHSPAMLTYLDNTQSMSDSGRTTLAQYRAGTAGRGARGAARGAAPPLMRPAARRGRGLNENYARELMELHTLGVDGGYTQKDVIEVARALTGWTVAPPAQGGQFIFRPEQHDAEAKVVLGVSLKEGRGIEDGEQVLDILARHPQTAKFISTKLARRFIADDPPASVVDRCAAVFTKTDGDIRQTVGCVVTSPEFFSDAAYRSKVKTPFEVVVSAFRAINATPDVTPRAAQQVTQLGQPTFGRQTPDGWPDRGEAWMNTGAILNRINFGVTLAVGGVAGVTLNPVSELEKLRNSPREQQVEGVIDALLAGEASAETREILMSGENPFITKAMTDSSMRAGSADMGMGAGMGVRIGGAGVAVTRPAAAAAGRGGRGAGAARVVDLKGLPQVIGLALGAPEFQRR